MDEILVDVEEFRKGKATIEESVSVFSSYSKNYLDDIIGQLKPFNSDFVAKIISVLDNMKDTKAPELVKALQLYAGQLSVIAEGFTELDDTVADKIGG